MICRGNLASFLILTEVSIFILNARSTVGQQPQHNDNNNDNNTISILEHGKELLKKSIWMGTARKLQNLVTIEALWKHWAAWSKCSADCGLGGFTVRRRSCETAAYAPCEGSRFDLKPCNVGIKCEATFSNWGIWGPCSVSCGEGVRARNRVCVTEDKQVKCKGVSSLLERCERQKCEQPKPVTQASTAFIIDSLAAVGISAYPVSLNYFNLREITAGLHGAVGNPNEVILKVPQPPLIADPRYRGKQSSVFAPFVWGAWSEWSLCSRRCGEGHRVRRRICIDNSQLTPIKVMSKWCGRGLNLKTVGCLGPCKSVWIHSDEDRMPSKVRIIETGSNIGPNIIAHHEPNKEMKISRAEIIETGSIYGPHVITQHENDKKDSLSKNKVIKTGDKSGPVVRTEHELVTYAASKLDKYQGMELKLTGETIFFIVLFCLCIVLIIGAFCVYFYQRVKEARKLKELRKGQPFYKQGGGGDEDVGMKPVAGVVRPAERSTQK